MYIIRDRLLSRKCSCLFQSCLTKYSLLLRLQFKIRNYLAMDRQKLYFLVQCLKNSFSFFLIDKTAIFAKNCRKYAISPSLVGKISEFFAAGTQIFKIGKFAHFLRQTTIADMCIFSELINDSYCITFSRS